MKDGFIRTAAVTPKIQVADPDANADEIIRLAAEAAENGAKIIVFPELCITGYTCGDLFLQELLLKNAKEALFRIIRETAGLDALIFAGLPWEKDGKLYNTAAAFQGGRLLGLVPKTCLPNYGEFYELRHFARGNREADEVRIDLGDGKMESVPFGTKILFACEEMPGLAVAAEICEDVWVPDPPSIRHALAGATVIVNCSASDETTGKDVYRESLIGGQSARLVCGYIYANAGEGESSQDLVFGGHNIIAENGKILSRSARFKNETIYADLDIERIAGERRRMTTFFSRTDEIYTTIDFHLTKEEKKLSRFVDPAPLVPHAHGDRQRRCVGSFAIQSLGV